MREVRRERSGATWVERERSDGRGPEGGRRRAREVRTWKRKVERAVEIACEAREGVLCGVEVARA